jgi:hypothetical protein
MAVPVTKSSDPAARDTIDQAAGLRRQSKLLANL